MGKKYLASVANVELFAKENGKLVHWASAKTLTDSAFGFTLSMEEVRAGQGGKLYGRFAHTSGMTFTMTDAMFDMKYIRALLGAESAGTAHVIVTEQATGGAKYTLKQTAVSLGSLCGLEDVLAWGHKADCKGEGDDEEFEVTENQIDLTGKPGTYCISYFVADPSAELMKIKAKFIPMEMVAYATVQEFAGDASAPLTGKPVGELIVKIPRFQLDGQFDLTLNMTSAASVALNGTALAVSSGDCEGEDYYAEIIEKETDSDFRTSLKDIVYDAETKGVFGIYNSGRIASIPNELIAAQKDATGAEYNGFRGADGAVVPLDNGAIGATAKTIGILAIGATAPAGDTVPTKGDVFMLVETIA